VFVSFDWAVFSKTKADSPFHQAAVGSRAAPPVSALVDRICRSGRSEPRDLLPAKGKVHLDVLLIGFRYKGRLAQATKTTGIFATVQVAFALSPAQNTPCSSHLESLGD